MRRKLIFLSGIAINPVVQNSGVGHGLLATVVRSQDFEYIAARTRNPNIMRLLGGFCSRIAPDLALDEPMQTYESEEFCNVLSFIGATAFQKGAYGEGLYGGDTPTHHDPQVMSRYSKLGLSNPSDALLVVGRIKNGKI